MRRAAVGVLCVAGAWGALLVAGCARDERTTHKPAAQVSQHATGEARVIPASAARGQSDRAALGFPRGRSEAARLVVEFSDFGCHYCGVFAREVLPIVDREFLSTGEVRWRLVPIATASTPHAREAAAAAVCAGQEGEAWAMHDLLFARQREWRRFGAPRDAFTRYARELGLDATTFRACLTASATKDTVEAMRVLAQQLGVRIAPTFFVAGRRVEGALAVDDVRAILRGER